MRRITFVGTDLQIRALKELKCPALRELCKELILMEQSTEKVNVSVSFSRTITIGDIVVLDRACSFDKKSVASLIQRTDPSEVEADSSKLTMVIRNIIDTFVGKVKRGLRHFSDASIEEILAAPFRNLPRPQLCLRQSSGQAPPNLVRKQSESKVHTIMGMS